MRYRAFASEGSRGEVLLAKALMPETYNTDAEFQLNNTTADSKVIKTAEPITVCVISGLCFGRNESALSTCSRGS